MKRSKALFLTLFLMVPSAWSLEERTFTGYVGVEAGVHEGSVGEASLLQTSRLTLRSFHDLTPEISLDLAGEARWQLSGGPLATSWSLFPVKNLLDLEAEDLASSDGKSFASLRLSRVSLHLASGPFDVTAGLMKPEWGVSRVFRPADHFFPTQPLVWGSDLPLASQGLDVKCFLFDDFSVEAAGRLLEGGTGDWVVRLVDKSVAYTVVPSFARLDGRNLLGLELLAVFPDFKAWAEGSYGLDPASPGEPFVHRFSGVLGFSTVLDGATLALEMLKDGTGGVLGGFSAGRLDSAYFFASGEKRFPGEWALRMGMVKSSCGGPLLFWPKVSWGFAKDWEAGFQAHLPFEFEPGALSLLPARAGFSVSYDL